MIETELVSVFSEDSDILDAQVAALLVSLAEQHRDLLGGVMVAALVYASKRLVHGWDDEVDEDRDDDVAGVPSGWLNEDANTSDSSVSALGDAFLMFQ
jgi:hypothetical protein